MGRYRLAFVSLDPRTPVLVGAAVANQREDDPVDAVEALELMARAIEGAATDAGSTAIIAGAHLFSVPAGTWSYADPGRLLAHRFGASDATTVVAGIGILQQDLIADACRRVAEAACDVAVVVGGEAGFRAMRARQLGMDTLDTTEPGETHADVEWAPDSLGIHDLELIRNAVTPATAYALIEHARMGRLGRTPEQHRGALGDLYAGFASVAAGNPNASDRTGYSAADIITPDEANRVIAWPYTKRLCSQWNVDQAAALIICSAEAAERFGVSRDRWVFPRSSAVSNHAVPVIQRAVIDASPGADLAASAALSLAGVGIDDVAHLDLYSCFPAAVEAFADALGVGGDRDLTVTGGMSFAGGPLNNYVLQAMVELVALLRAEPGSVGLSSSVSVYLQKQGFGLWSNEPPAGAFRHEDVSTAVGAHSESAPRPVAADHVGPARVATWTVDHQAGEPFRAVVVCDVEMSVDMSTVVGGARTLASTGDRAICEAMSTGDWIGTTVDVRPDGSFTLS
jgi:acetyl-CoA C-acetyltransferase